MSNFPSEVHLFVNAGSRRGRVGFQIARETLKLPLASAKQFERAESLILAAEKAIENGADMIIVGGGDGTLSAVAHLMEHRDVTMGVLPLGTGNSFARDLQIDVTVRAACAVIEQGQPLQVDIAAVGDRRFLNVATMGLSTTIALGLEPNMKRIMGRGSYLYSLLKALAMTKPFDVSLELDNEVHRFPSLQVVIGNGRLHAGPFPVAPDASINEGYLSIYALASPRKSAFLKMALSMRGGKHVDLDEVKAFRTQRGRLVSHPHQPITIDGEPASMSPVDFRVIPGALRVMVPQSFVSMPTS